MISLQLTNESTRQRIGRRAFAIALLSVGACGLAGTLVRAQDIPDKLDLPVGEGRIYNLTNQPFVFQLHRADGAAWTESHTIPAGKYFAVKAPQGGARRPKSRESLAMVAAM